MNENRKIQLITPLKPISTRGGKRVGAGRPKGSVSPLTRSLREAIEIAFDRVGGVNYLIKMAEQQPVCFMGMLAKVLPQQIDGNIAHIVGMPTITLSSD